MSTLPAAADLVVRGAQVMTSEGAFSPARIEVTGGRITRVDRGHDTTHGETRPGGPVIVEAQDMWMIPGVVDCHTHLGWTTFLHDDDAHGHDDADGPGAPVAAQEAAWARRRAQVAPGLAATVAAGVTRARDAGGAEARLRDEVADGVLAGPRLTVAVEILTAEPGEDADDLRRRVSDLAGRGADWIKLMATGGVMAPAGSELESAFTRDQIVAAVDEARRRGVRVMVHAWGGPAITDAIEAGAASIEHGIFLTTEQAAAGAARGTVLVPTLAIYAEVAQMAERGELPPAAGERAARVVAAHPAAVRTAHEAGMAVALGSDFGTSAQHGRNLVEIDHLARAGLGPREALLAATRNGARLLGTGSGLLEVGEVFDAVLLGADPSDTSIFARPDVVVSVFQGGRAVR
ncbi:amidohydrolase family protein [Sanguibacter suarezii]|uniref:amidohydrolase family protein n=1 Tax=Sanguibacter suarezii TaxID=60921 RepID=UPI00082A9884|nr:amidohydrolase family protein [Sanguibacter suarezii]